MSPLEVLCKQWVQGEAPVTRTVCAYFTEYKREVTESDCVDCVTALLQGGATGAHLLLFFFLWWGRAYFLC